MISLGLVGKDISHSRSKSVYEDILKREVDYHLFDYLSPSEIPELDSLFNVVSGVSITAPYKKHFLSEVTLVGDVTDLGIFNCIRKNKDTYEATNTDYLAIKDFIKNENMLRDYNILLLGDGSMAEITKFLFEKEKIPFLQMSRKLNSDFSELDLVKIKDKFDKDLFVINSCGRSYNYAGPLGAGITFWDYNYSHEFHLNRLKESSIRYIDGMELLREQARFALEFWGVNY